MYDNCGGCLVCFIWSVLCLCLWICIVVVLVLYYDMLGCLTCQGYTLLRSAGSGSHARP